MHKCEIKVSGDGSHTIKNDLFGAFYHSIHGAIGESQVVFVDNCLAYQVNKGHRSLKIFEMGFGTGLNALMAFQFAQNKEVHIDYHSVEAFPIDLDTASQLNYGTILGDGYAFETMHTVSWNEKKAISPFFALTKYNSHIEDLDIPEACNGVFFDAFAPTCQPNLWGRPILQKMYDCLLPGGVLTSYCAQGEFRRQLNTCGFTTERLPGPPFKREMIRATKPQAAV